MSDAVSPSRPPEGAAGAPDAELSARQAMATRRSIRAFLPKPVAPAILEEILALAAHAPSGSNVQPWQVLVLEGEPLERFGRELHDLYLSGDKGEEEFAYYPQRWREPYLARRRKVGWDLYAALGIAKGDTAATAAHQARNFLFFGAPVGLIFTIDRDLERGSILDYGMFLQNIMIAARGLGLDTCPQAAFIPYWRQIAHRLAIPDERMLVCGMALGYGDPDAPQNVFPVEREPPSGFMRRVERLAE